MYKTSEYFSILQINKDSMYLEKFFEFYKKDISKFFPNFNYQQANYLVKENIYYFFILRDLIPAGILIVEKKENFQYIHLDYVIPAYRDLKIAMFLFVENIDYMRNLGFTNLHTHASHNLHSNYLRKIGFLKIGKDDLGEIYEKKLN